MLRIFGNLVRRVILKASFHIPLLTTVPSSSGLGRLVLIQKIAGSTPAGITIKSYLPKASFLFHKKRTKSPLILWKDASAIASEARLEQAAYQNRHKKGRNNVRPGGTILLAQVLVWFS